MFYCPCCTAQPHCGQTTFFGRSQCFEICCDLPYTRAMGAPIAPFRVLVEHLILQLCDEFFSACQLHWILSHFHHFLYPYTFLFSLIFLSLSFFQASEEESGKPFQCPICGLVIKRKSYWKRHMVIHTGLKSHQCPLCPFRCARKDNLKSHMKVSRPLTDLPMRRTQPSRRAATAGWPGSRSQGRLQLK